MTPAPDEPMLRTALYDQHVAAGARLIPFGGWLMPVQYRGILAEHETVRESVGLFDLSHMGRLHFRGDAGRRLLQRLSTNDVEALKPGRAQYGLICDDAGGILDDTVAYNLSDHQLLVVNAGNRLKILEWIARHQSDDDRATVDDLTAETVMIGVQGPRAEAFLQRLTDLELPAIRYYAAARGTVGGVDGLVARTGYTGEDGFEIVASAGDGQRLWDLLAAQDEPARAGLCGLGARDTLRLEAGMALYGHEITEQTNPYEANLGRVVKLQKDEFAGRAALERLSRTEPVRRLVGFQMLDNAVPRQGYAILRGDRPVGQVTSGTHSPTLKRNLGMGYLAAELSEPGSEISVVVRERPRRAVVVALPHVPHRTRRATSKAASS